MRVGRRFGRIDYYPFGMAMPGRTYLQANSLYRYGFNGKESAHDVAKGDFDFEARILDTRIGRWLSADPMQALFASINPYNFSGNNPIYFTDPDGKTLKPYDQDSRTQLQAHFERMFDGKVANLLTAHLSMDGSHMPISPKEFKKAIKGLDAEQKVMARAYYKLINSEKLVVGFLSSDENKKIPSELLLSANNYRDFKDKTIGQLAKSNGGYTSINDGTRKDADATISAALLISTSTDFSKAPVAVLDKDGYAGTIVRDNDGSALEDPNIAYGSDLDEIVIHEVGHGLFSGGIIASDKNSSLPAIQLSNQYRKKHNQPLRAGTVDHGINTKEDPKKPGSGKVIPTAPVTAPPADLKKD